VVPLAARKLAAALGRPAVVHRGHALAALDYPKACDDETGLYRGGRRDAHGGLPYADAVERKPPLLFYLYEGMLRVFGERNYFALHVAALMWTLATMALLAVTMRRLFDAGTGWARLCSTLSSPPGPTTPTSRSTASC